MAKFITKRFVVIPLIAFSLAAAFFAGHLFTVISLAHAANCSSVGCDGYDPGKMGCYNDVTTFFEQVQDATGSAGDYTVNLSLKKSHASSAIWFVATAQTFDYVNM